MEKKFSFTLTKEQLETLPLDTKKELHISVQGEKILLSQGDHKKNTQSNTIRWFFLPTLLASVIFFWYFQQQKISQVPLTGNVSIASFVFLLGLIFGMLSFSYFFIKEKRHEKNTPAAFIYWRNLPTILISFAIMLGFIILVVFWMLGIIFAKATFDLYTATLLFMLFTSIVNYTMIYFAKSLSPELILQVLGAVIVGGVGFSMMTNRSLLWWQKNFSFLGTDNAKNSWQFNFTLMVASLLMIALVDYLFVALQHKFPKTLKLTILRVLLTLTALNLFLVGFFPNNGLGKLHELHNQAANFLVYSILILIIAIYWLLPNVTKEFLGISYAIAGVLLVCDILFQKVGYLSLTAFEMVAFILAFAWILLLLQNLLQLLHGENNFTLILKEEEPKTE